MKHYISMFVIAVATGACVPDTEIIRTDILRGKELFVHNCASCHGVDARGAGMESLGLGMPPPSLRTLAAKNGGVFPRGDVMATIDGLDRHDNLLASMPEFGEQDLGPAVLIEADGLLTPIPADLLALVNYLETLQDQ